MDTSSSPSDALRDDIANAHSHDSLPPALSISTEAQALYGHLTGRTLGYPTAADTVDQLARYRIAALASAIIVELIAHHAATGDEEYLETMAEEFLAHPTITEDAGPIVAAIASAIGPHLPHLIEYGSIDERADG